MSLNSSTGIGTNLSNTLTEELIKGADATIINGEDYNNGYAFQCNIPNGEVARTQLFPAGTFSGTYNIGFFYDSNTATTQGTPLMRIEIYEDGVLLPEDTTYYSTPGLTQYQFDLNYIKDILTYGLFLNFQLKSTSTYEIIIKTSATLSNTAIFDYIMFEKVATNTVIDGSPEALAIGMRGGGYTDLLSAVGTQPVEEVVFGEISGTWVSMEVATMGFTYNTKFKSIIGVWSVMTDGNGKINIDWASTSYTNSQVLLNIRNVSSTSWTATESLNLRILVKGYI